MMLFVLILMQATLFQLSTSQECQCNVGVINRRPCSVVSARTSEQSCNAAGCCYDRRNYGIGIFFTIHKCYAATGSCQCRIPLEERESCGYLFQNSCNQIGCCYDARSNIRCFKRKARTSAPTPARITTTTTISIPAAWSSWENWNKCSSSCSSGTQNRRRLCQKEGKTVLSEECSGISEEVKVCNKDLCQKWASWTTIGTCSGRCGTQGRLRIFRLCQGRGRVGRSSCFSGYQSCINSNCPRASWSEWMKWSACSRCSPGKRIRQRTCTINEKRDNIRRCAKNGYSMPSLRLWREFTQVENCNLHMCNAWSRWSQFSPCTHSCTVPGVNSIRYSLRKCLNKTTETLLSKDKEYESCAVKRALCDVKTCESVALNQDVPLFFEPAPALDSVSEVEDKESEETSTAAPTEDLTTADSKEFKPETDSVVSWGEWTSCSDSCSPGISRRFPTSCIGRNGSVTEDISECDIPDDLPQKPCNVDMCQKWSDWIDSNCSYDCPNVSVVVRGYKKKTRTCEDGNPNSANHPASCYFVDLPCLSRHYCAPSTTSTFPAASSTPTSSSPASESLKTTKIPGAGQSQPPLIDDSHPFFDETQPTQHDLSTLSSTTSDKNLDILFLVDSSDFVDNCRKLRREGFSPPIAPEFINEVNTPVYAKIKKFMEEFTENWKAVTNTQTRVAIQLMSKPCNSISKRNLHLVKSLADNHINFTEKYIQPLPYQCGGFFFDLALTCAERNVFTSSQGDRSEVPDVVVALVSSVPRFAQPSDILLSAISRRLRNAGVVTISAAVTPQNDLKTGDWLRYQNMLKTFSCSFGSTTCSNFIGSIWDENKGTPAERIRKALQQANVL